MSNVNHNFKALISKNINISSSNTDHLTKANTCESEGKSGHNLTVNTKTAMVWTPEMHLHQSPVFRKNSLTYYSQIAHKYGLFYHKHTVVEDSTTFGGKKVFLIKLLKHKVMGEIPLRQQG